MIERALVWIALPVEVEVLANMFVSFPGSKIKFGRFADTDHSDCIGLVLYEEIKT